MSLLDQINEDLKHAMKSKNQAKLRAVRSIKSALLILKTESADKEITGQDEMKLLQKLVRQRKESAEIYSKQGRDDLVKDELEELEVIEYYLPKQLSVEEIIKELNEIIGQVGARSISDLGKVMPLAMKQLAGRADGKTISDTIKSLLTH